MFIVRHFLSIQFILGLILCIFSCSLDAVPTDFSTELFIAITDDTGDSAPLNGVYDVQYDLLYEEDGIETIVFTKEFDNLSVAEGLLVLTIEDDDDLDINIFYENILSFRITISSLLTSSSTPASFGPASFQGTEIINSNFNSLSFTVLSNSSILAERFFDDHIFYINEEISSSSIAIATKNISGNVHVDGSVRSDQFIGDASNLSNVGYTMWTDETTKIYYMDGNVGMGLSTPDALLHVSGDVWVSETIYITQSLEATFKGDASNISNFNASNFSTGTISPDRLDLIYNGITGLGVLTSGTWEASVIAADYINPAQTIHDSILTDSNISGLVEIVAPLEIESTYPFNVSTPFWAFNNETKIATINTTDNLAISTPYGQYSGSMNIKTTNGINLILSSTGNIGINTAPTNAELTVTKGIQVGYSDHEIPGFFRFNSDQIAYESFNGTEWGRFDYGGAFNGYSLFAEDEVKDPIIYVNESGHIGVNVDDQADHFVVSGNLILLGNTNAAELSDLGDGEYFAWLAKSAALRIGKTINDSEMFSASNAGDYSVGIGKNAAAAGKNAVNISYNNNDDHQSLSSGEGVVAIATSQGVIGDDYSILLSSSEVNLTSTDASYGATVIFSTSDSSDVGGSNNIAFSTNELETYNSTNDDYYSNTIVFAGNSQATMPTSAQSSPIGNNSVFWDSKGAGYNFGDNFDHSIVLGTGLYSAVGINTNDITIESFQEDSAESLVVGGGIQADYFEGPGNKLTGNLRVEYLTVGDDQIYPTRNLAPAHIYVSTADGFFPENTIGSASISTSSIGSDHFNNFSIQSADIGEQMIITDLFSDLTINSTHIGDETLTESDLSEITSSNFEPDSVVSEKIATDSLYTYHFIDEAITTAHIATDVVNGIVDGVTLNHIALHAILNDDLYRDDDGNPERYLHEKFADASATSRTIGNSQLITIVDEDGDIINSHFIYEDDSDNPHPQIQEHHIQTNEVMSFHIPTDNINDRILDISSIDTVDLTKNVDETICDGNDVNGDKTTCIAIDRTVPSKDVFITRHFTNRSVDTRTFNDDPTANFQLQPDQIIADAVGSSELATASITVAHIKDGEIQGYHFIEKSIEGSKFAKDSIVSNTIANGAITSSSIEDDAITPNHISLGSITGDNIAIGALSSVQLATNSITAENIPSGAISGDHIIDRSLNGTLDFSEDVFQTQSFQDSAIKNEDITSNAITSELLGSNTVSGNKIVDGTVTWADFPDPTESSDFMNTELFEPGSISTDQLCLDTDGCSKITGQQLATGSISSADLVANEKYDIEKLVVPLAVSKGGTGLSSITDDLIVYVYNDDVDGIRMGQTEDFRWDPTYDYLRIGDTGTAFNTDMFRIITSGNVMVEDGVLILERTLDGSDYSYIYVTLKNNSVQFTNSTDLTSTDSNMSLKVYDVSIETSVTTGGGAATNSFTHYGGLAIGKNGFTDLAPPENGLIVSSSVQVGREIIASIVNEDYPLIVEDSTADGIVKGSSDNISVTTITTDSTPPIISEGKIVIEGPDADTNIPIGIDVTATIENGPAIVVTMPEDSIDDSGITSIVNSTTCTETCAAIDSILTGDSLQGILGYNNGDIISGLYISTPNGLAADASYSGNFDGIFYSEYFTDNESLPTDNLTIDSIKFDGSVSYKRQSGSIVNTVDWTKGNVIVLQIDNNNRSINLATPPNESANLIVQINHVGDGSLEWVVDEPYTIAWLGGYNEPEFSNIDGSTDFIIFHYSQESQTYYAGILYDFKESEAAE